MPAFARTIGIGYSGAETATSGLKGLRIYLAEGEALPVEVLPPPSSRKYWTRKAIAEWLVERLAEDAPTLVGIDHGFSFPLRYFEVHGLLPDWPAFLDDFQRHWPTDGDYIYVDFVRDGVHGNGAARLGNAGWRRLTEQSAGGARSVFHFSVPGSVAKATHAGIPWLRFIRARLGARVHFWPFDGWDIATGRSAIAEVYPALWSRGFAAAGRTRDQHEAFSIAAWLSRADRDGHLAALLNPDLSPSERTLAQVEGWILGVPGSVRTVTTTADFEFPAEAPGVLAPDALRDSKARQRMSPAAVRSFFSLADLWRLGVDQRRTLLGEISRPTYHDWRNGKTGALTRDQLERISLLLGIHKGLKLLFADEASATRWLLSPNRDLPFGGDSPLGRALRGSIDDLYAVRRYIDAWRGMK